MRKWLVTALILTSLSAYAGSEKFQINFMLTPTLEWMRFGQSANASAYNSLWGNKLSYNAGIEYKRFLDPSLSFSTGIRYMNKGFRNADDFYINPTSGKRGVTLMSAHVIAVPLDVNIHHRLARRIEMIYTVGISGGYLFQQTIRNSNYTEEDMPDQGLWDAVNGKSNVALFVPWFVDAHAGVGIQAYLRKKIVLVVQPTYRVQLNNARDYLGQFSSGDPFTARLNSFGVDLKVGYFFIKNIRNRRKGV